MGFMMNPPIAVRVKEYVYQGFQKPPKFGGYIKAILMGFEYAEEKGVFCIIMREDLRLTTAPLENVTMPDRPEWKQMFAEYVLTEGEEGGGKP